MDSESPNQLRAGKLPAGLLSSLLSSIERDDPRVVIGPAMGEDAAVIDFGERRLIATSDPVTFATDLIGWYAVQVNANDIAATGGDPKWFMATLLLPAGQSMDLTEQIFGQVREAAVSLGVSLVGGHTEVTIGLPRPIMVGTMLGEAPRGGAIPTGDAQPGDGIILTKGIAIEGTAILAAERERLLLDAGLTTVELERARSYLFDPGISVVEAARIAREVPGVHAMHDPTEGGLATGLLEMASASGVGMHIHREAVPEFPESSRICAALGVDPLGTIASGALLIAVAADHVQEALVRLARAGVPGACIGRAVERAEGILLESDGHAAPLPTFHRDEIARVMGEA